MFRPRTMPLLCLVLGIAVVGHADDDARPTGGAAGDLEAATHVEIDPLRFDLGREGKLETMAMDARGRLLAGVSFAKAGGSDTTPEREPRRDVRRPPAGRQPLESGPTGPRDYAVKRIDPATGRIEATWPVDVAPKMLHACDDGTLLVGSDGAFRLLNDEGEVTARVGFGDFLEGRFLGTHCSGVTASEEFFFVAFGDGFSLRATEEIVRFDRRLGAAKSIVERQFGCCAHLDLDVRDGVLLIAENSRHRVNRFTFDGEPLGTWGRRDRVDLAGFAACCNPVNFDFGPDGVLYTAESGIGRVKRYSPAGEYLGFVGYVDTTKFDNGSRLAAMSCYIPVEVAPDGKRIYVMDVRTSFVRVLQQKEE